MIQRPPVSPEIPAPTALPLPRMSLLPAVAPPPDPDPKEQAKGLFRRLWLVARAGGLGAYGLVRGRPVAVPPVTLVHQLLVVRTDRIGDMALTSAALTDLKAHFRHARLTVTAPAPALAVLEGHPAVDRRVPLEAGKLPLELLRHVDLVVDFTPDESLHGALIARATRAPWRAGFSAGGREAFFTLRGPVARQDRHIVELNRDLLASLGVTRRDSLPSLVVSPQEKSAALQRCATLGAASPRVLLHPGGHYPSQRWEAERFATVIERLTERLGVACLVAVGPGEESLLERIRAVTPDALLVGAVPVRALMGLIAVCDLFVGNNSGPLHVAGALGVPTLSIMGPTDPARFMPCGPKDHVVRRPIACSPCGRGRCWHHTCLASIDAEDVALCAQSILQAPPSRRAAA